MFALLAFLCFPAFGVAEDSAPIQYRDTPPDVAGDPSGGSSASSSGSNGGASAPGKSSTPSGTSAGGGSAAGGSSSEEGAAAAGGGGKGGAGGGGQGADAGRDSAAKRAGVGGGQPIAVDKAPIAHESGSSPLVPILIALAVLAALSVGVVAMRRRPPGGDSRVSPEAG